MTELPPAPTVTWRPEAAAELLALDEQDEALADAARQAVADIIGHHKTGKALGDRTTTGVLGGLYRLKFDVSGVRPERYRVIYRQSDDGRVTIWAIGAREGRAVYRTVLGRWAGR
ncbi:MAG: type II toxin-antitoxin system RelE/ParE family toxin [Propionibacteriaceae bacterium]|nr:type II toxin-antitoxin system RelE/ParE family toxin [Propionibacteriaceae bacterium]